MKANTDGNVTRLMESHSKKPQKLSITQAPGAKTKITRPKRSTRPARKPQSKGDSEYEVEKVLDSRLNKKKGTIEYLVKWEGFRSSENTWEPADNLKQCRQKLQEYRESQK